MFNRGLWEKMSVHTPTQKCLQRLFTHSHKSISDVGDFQHKPQLYIFLTKKSTLLDLEMVVFNLIQFRWHLSSLRA